MKDRTRNEIRARFLNVGTAVICDVFDELEFEMTALATDIRRHTSGQVKLAGWAYPIEGKLSAETGPDQLKLEIVDGIPADSITVWGGNDASGICLFGDLIASTMLQRECKGAVVDGGFRDVEAISSFGFPVFARYVSPVQAVGRWRVQSHGKSIKIGAAVSGQVKVDLDDFILGDEDGVVVIRQKVIHKVLNRAEEIVKQEEEARELGADGMTAKEMLERFGHV